jgi:ribosome-interacting GTPase 1
MMNIEEKIKEMEDAYKEAASTIQNQTARMHRIEGALATLREMQNTEDEQTGAEAEEDSDD